MDFLDREPIYLQISKNLRDNILNGRWAAGDRIPSVRDLAVAMEVNPNTVARTYQVLQEGGLIENQRGIGFFVTAQALELTRNQTAQQLEAEDLPRLFQILAVLDWQPAELARRYQQYLTNLEKNHEN